MAEAADEIPKDWGWPEAPYQLEDLQEYVLKITQPTQQEKWDHQLEARALDSKLEDFMEEKAFANLMLNKEGTGEDKEAGVHKGIDPNAYKKGRWYRFLNHKGDCYVYVHNYTRDVTAARPENFTDLTEEEKKRLEKLGVPIRDLPRHIERVYDKEKQIPIIYGSEEACEALKSFFFYDTYSELLDASKLKRINAGALEACRTAMVNAVKHGKTLCIYMGDVLPEFREKICISKYRDTFPSAIFQHGGMEVDSVREKIFRDEDKEAGTCMIRKGFRVCIVVMYDNMMYTFSSFRKEELQQKIPNFENMSELRCYNDDDKKKILEQMRA